MERIKELFNMAISCRKSVAGNNTQYSITTIGDTVYLAIEGSVDKQDWVYNFMFWIRPSSWKRAKPYKNMDKVWYAHAGFSEAWKLARDQIAAEIHSVVIGKKLVILGYSHGAALATLAHEYFNFHGYNPSTYVFGCPRVLWFPSESIRSRFFDLTMTNRRGDLVAHVPPALFGFRHIANPELIGKPAMIWWKRHLIAEYFEAME